MEPNTSLQNVNQSTTRKIIFVIGENHGNPSVESLWLRRLHGIIGSDILLVREENVDDRSQAPAVDGYSISVTGIEERDLAKELDTRIFNRLLEVNRELPPPVLSHMREAVAKAKNVGDRIDAIEKLDLACKHKWMDNYFKEERSRLADEFMVPATDKLSLENITTLSAWRYLVLTQSNLRLSLNPNWVRRLDSLAIEHPNKDILVTLGAAHLITVRPSKESAEYPGILRLLIDEAVAAKKAEKSQAFSLICWAWNNTPTAAPCDEFLKGKFAPNTESYVSYDCLRGIQSEPLPLPPAVTVALDRTGDKIKQKPCCNML